MQVNFLPSFEKSLSKLAMRETWWYKTYSFFRYDLRAFFRNVWLFRKLLWNYRWWDYRFMLEGMKISLDDMAPKFEADGMEVDISRMKKVAMMKRASEIIGNFMEDNFIEQAETELGKLPDYDLEFEDVEDRPGSSRLVDKLTPEEKEQERKVFDRARELEKLQWIELFSVLKGQDPEDYKSIRSVAGAGIDWNDWFNGSGMQGWWD